MYYYDVVVKKFRFAISSSDEILVKKSSGNTAAPTVQQLIRQVVDKHFAQCHYLSVLIRFHVMHQNTLVQLINTVSNLIFHCNNCDGNTAFVTRAGLTMVPNVPWHRAPRRKGPPRHQENFLGYLIVIYIGNCLIASFSS